VEDDDYLSLESHLIFPEFVSMLARCAQLYHERQVAGGKEPQSDPDSLASQVRVPVRACCATRAMPCH
jgi:hypothetical protein